MGLDFPFPGLSKLKIYSQNFYEIKWELFQSKSGRIRKTQVEHFDNEFQVRCDSEETFDEIITPEMMEKLERFHRTYDAFAMGFINNKLYVALSTGQESFEPDYSREVNYQYDIAKIKRDMKFITDTIDIFYDL